MLTDLCLVKALCLVYRFLSSLYMALPGVMWDEGSGADESGWWWAETDLVTLFT